MKSKIVFYLSLGYLLLTSCSVRHDMEYYRESGTRFHTVYNITYQSDRVLTDRIDSVMTAFNASLNPFDTTSIVSKINANETVVMDAMLKEVVTKAIEVSRLTDGQYDITGAPYFDIWGFGTKKGITREATPAEIDSISAFVGYDKLLISGDSLLKSDERIRLNPSSLSKGYLVDLVAQTLEDNGVSNYLVEIGGEIVAKGLNPNGECWRLGINKPVEDNTSTINDVLYAVPLCNGEGMASSGDYRNYKEIGGQKVAHTIDVLTGRPAHQDILSATVVAPTCMEADAWATAFMAMGLERSIVLLNDNPNLKVCFVYANTETGNLDAYIKGLEIEEVE